MVVYLKSSACCLLSTARGPALARALPLALGLALTLALALAVALALLRVLALALPLALRLALPLVFPLASASSFARRKRPSGPPEEPTSTNMICFEIPGGGSNI